MSEAIYDAEIAPKLVEIARLCEGFGLPFVAAVQYARNSHGETRCLLGAADLPMRMVSMVLAAGDNVDGFFIALSRYCREAGIDTSGSIVMKLLADSKFAQVPSSS